MKPSALPIAALLSALVSTAVQAEGRSVALTGQMGRQALLSIDGAAPRVLAVGSSVQGVRLLSVDANQAVVEIDGKRRTVRLGEAAVRFGGDGGASNGSTVSLSSDGRGHFIANGQINGRGVRMMVDTGATTVAMGEDEAQRLGITYKNGQRIGVSTANGVTAAYRVQLNSVRIGDVEVFNVEATVAPMPMPYVLLGNSYLNRFQMKRENDTLTLERRF
ncbi:MAG TPA: TIGR02281 family clan AA aspartic protease [Methylibium sp.]|uniref:retropepsin-like aspartic protease family protein n=1 Tax=Methylibium sp. TaxID=2067992 RepID=UPI002DBA4872|nr:TIGR02281 family clan AA aspartic protease [Methylibium sp.]HEU4458758.1 TIGR02281 family clan AA aspartic protease [Methylibium sp.]